MPDIEKEKPWLALANTDLSMALLEVWRYLRADHQNFERDLQRQRCEEEAKLFREALEKGDTLPDVHPAAALRAMSEYLYVLESGSDLVARRLVTKDGKAFWLVPRREGWISRVAATQPGHIEFWLRNYQVVPVIHDGIRIEIIAPPAFLKKSKKLKFECVASGFLDGVLPKWNAHSPYRCEILTDAATRWNSVLALLNMAAKEGASIVVLPELTVDREVREHICEWLREQPRTSTVSLVVAGSFHEDDAGKRRNIAHVFDAFGDEVLRHVKLRPMRAMPKGDPVDEDISSGAEVFLLHAWFGLVGVAICLDFCEIGNTPVADLWQAIGPALMLVPSMGADSTNDAHGDRAKVLRLLHGTATVVASQHPEDAEAYGLYWVDKKHDRVQPKVTASLPWV